NHHEDKDHEEDHDHHDENDHEEDHDEKEHEGDHGHEGHKHGPNDPHLWLSLTNLEKMAKSIYENLAKIDSKNELSYKENYHLLQEKFEGLEVKFKEAFSKHQGKAIIVPHEAFAYLSQEFGFEQIGLEGINSDSEPTLTKIAEISKIMKEKNITTVFYDLGKSDKAAQTIAKETGANVKAISTLEVLSDEDQKEARDLLSLMEMNLQNILDSFEGK
ncbi:MAG: zinc ABC transporter substrate-binding protein, partial [Tissierellia bacterium]|nr:zinc ABC transporter substrate-binding protein [Tissierellia bacterium]